MPTLSVDPHRLEELLTYCTDFAKQMLHHSGAFHPFGATLSPEEKVTAVGGWTGEEHPKGAEVFRLLQSSMQSQFEEKKIVAGAIAADVTVPREYQSPFPNAIRVLLECAGYSRFMYLPYRVTKPGIFARLTKAGFRCEFGEFISVDVPPMISVGKKTGEPDGTDNDGAAPRRV